MRPAAARAGDRRRERVARLAQLLGTLGYRSVLGRGYALVRDAAGQPLRSAAGVAPGARLGLEFADGILAAEALGSPDAPDPSPAAEAPKRRATAARPPAGDPAEPSPKAPKVPKAPRPPKASRAAKGAVNQGDLF